MNLLPDLEEEHTLIERMIGAFQTFAGTRARGKAASDDGPAFLEFFRAYAGLHHHAREEEILFPALIRETAAPDDRGPIATLRADHRALEALLADLEALLLGEGDPSLLPERAARYGEALLHHIDAENHVLFPEAARRFERAGVRDLPSPAPDERAAAARAAAELLLLRWPPSEIPGVLRGESCTACPAFGDRCEGIERSWSSDEEWDDMLDRVG